MIKKFFETAVALFYLRRQIRKIKQKIDILDLKFIHYIPNHYIGSDYEEYRKNRSFYVKQHNEYVKCYNDLFYQKENCKKC